MNISQAQLQEKIELVKWQKGVKQKYNLMTVHSLLLDNNPKFKQLKQIVENYNQESYPNRIKFQQAYVQQLFRMLSELSRIPVYENQIEYLDKIYLWASANNQIQDGQEGNQRKVRPTTATTKARSQSAYSRATTNRPISGNFSKKTVKYDELPPLNTVDPKIDYSRLKDGEKQFYCGLRSLHSEYEHPKKRLKDYQRKIFYEDGTDSDVQIIETETKVEVNQQQLIQQIELAQQQQNLQQEGAQGQNQQVNIDDIPIQGEEEPLDAQLEQKPEVIDKLRPKIKVYDDPKGVANENHKNYFNSINQIRMARNYNERKINEDVEFAQLGAMWAQSKGRTKSELKRRAESARIIKKHIQIGSRKPTNIDTERQTQNIINFENIQPHSIDAKTSRPQTAFIANNPKNREQLIQKAFITSKLSGHVSKYEPPTTLSIPSQFKVIESSLAVHGGPPKRKTFEEILREAEERVVRDSQGEVVGVKQAFAKNKISIGANKIAKSISYNDKQLPGGEGFTGLITGMTMLKNPFIKIAKKKKKKKKK